MQIYLIRHTTPAIDKGICYGQTDVALSDSAEQEIKSIQSQIAVPLDGVFSSPLIRCTLLAKTLKDSPKTDSRLKELNFGDWENKKWDDIPSKELNPWMKNYTTTGPPNGESYHQLQDRVVETFEGITSQHLEHIAIVTHAGPIRALLGHLLNISLEDTFKLKIDYGSITKLTLSHNQFMIDYINHA